MRQKPFKAVANVAKTQLLTIFGEVLGVLVKFLVDSGASENFISEHLVSEYDLEVKKS